MSCECELAQAMARAEKLARDRGFRWSLWFARDGYEFFFTRHGVSISDARAVAGAIQHDTPAAAVAAAIIAVLDSDGKGIANAD